MAKTDLTNQRQVFVEEYVRSGDNHYAGDAVQSIRDGVLDGPNRVRYRRVTGSF